MKNLMLFILIQFCLSIICMSQQDYYTLSGKTQQIPDNTQLIMLDVATNTQLDSTYIVDNQFFFKGDASPYKEVYLLASYDGQMVYCPLFLENQNMVFDAREDDFKFAKITGSKLQDQATELMNKARTWYEQLSEIEKQFKDAFTDRDQAALDKEALNQQRDHCFERIHAITKTFIENHPDYLVSVQSLTFLKHYLPKEDIRQLYDGLTKEMKQTSYGDSVRIWLETAMELTIGDIAPDFELPNLQEKTIALSKIKAKYILLEFGASGCGPCRQENPNLLKAYQHYKDQGFEIVSVWLDKNKKHWENTVQKDQMIWTTVCDLKGMKGEVPLLYNVNGIPDNFLLDSDRKIIAMDLRGAQLGKKLATLLEPPVTLETN